MGYLGWGVVIWLILWLGFSLIAPLTTEAKAVEKGLVVHGGLPSPMPAIAEARALSDIELVVKTVICECGANEPLGCYDAVTQTIITRAGQRDLTYEQVVLEPWQYSCWNSDIPVSLQRLRDSPEEMLPVGYYRIIRDIVKNALSGAESQYAGIDHYYSHCLIKQPFWVAQATFLRQVGCHRFYRIGE